MATGAAPAYFCTLRYCAVVYSGLLAPISTDLRGPGPPDLVTFASRRGQNVFLSLRSRYSSTPFLPNKK